MPERTTTELDASAGQDLDAWSGDVLDDLKTAADKTGRGAVAAVLAGTIAVGAAGVTPDQVPLPEPVPIVQTVDMGGGVELPDQVIDDQDQADKQSWRKILKIILMALAALALVAGLVFGAVQGCTTCAGPLAAPVGSSQESSTQG